MSSAVQLLPIDATPGGEAGSSYGSGMTGSLLEANDPEQRRRRTSTRKRIERVAHERAPRLATMVAGSSSALKRPHGGSKRYSAPGQQHLIPDEEGHLHDPEYESIRIIKRPPSVSSDNSSAVTNSSSDDEDEVETALSSPRSQMTSFDKYRNTSLRVNQPFSSRLQGATSPNTLYSSSYRTSHLRPESVTTTSSNPSTRKSVRTYAEGKATYLAPSITMPPTVTAGHGTYNPYTYVPTTSSAGQAYSSSLIPHSRRPGQSTGLPARTHGPSRDTAASPITWASSYTPSAEHPERHRTRHQHSKGENIEAPIKRSFQKLKLDVSFGLLKLKQQR